MLKWFVDFDVQDTKKLIEEEDVEIRPENVPNAVIDDNVDIHLIRSTLAMMHGFKSWML